MRLVLRLLPISAVLGLAGVVLAADIPEIIREVKEVGPEGKGHATAVRAARELQQEGPDALLPILRGLNDANPLATNWLRGAFESIADRTLKEGHRLPAESLETFIRDTQQDAPARRLAYEWLVKIDGTAADRLIPGMLRDPGADFRRDAVARLLDRAAKLQEQEQKDEAIAVYRQALEGATDDDQVKAIVKPLQELGETVDLPRHFGFITAWQLLGPFDNTENKGFTAAFPPEEEIDLSAVYAGKEGEVRWEAHETDHEYGILDLAKETAPHKGAVTYAFAEFDSPEARPAEIRLGSPNAWKLWLNGELKFARNEYHRNMQLDQYRVPVELRAGRNRILLKVCQNEQPEDWAQRWQYQLRICDASGAAILPRADLKTTRKEADTGSAASARGN